MSTIPTITEQDIRNLVGEASLQRGQKYFRDDTIFDTRREGMTLKAKCQGSRSSPYRVEVTFNDTEVIGTDCSCPIGGHCKHVVALLFTWLAQPEEFLEQQDVDTLLGQCDKAELISLIKQMLRREPDLEYLLSTVGTAKQGAPVDAALYRRQVEIAFRNGSYEWEDVSDVADELSTIMESGDNFVQRRDYTSATAVYEAIITGIIDHYYEYEDHDADDLSEVVAECVDELKQCLDAVQDSSALRERILRVLFAIHRFDLEAGGIGFGDDAPDLLLEHTTVEERHTIAGWVRKAIAENTGAEHSGNHRREWLGGFLLELEADTLDDETYLQICREAGRISDTVERLLELGRVDEAIKETEHVDDYKLLALADLFVKHKQDMKAESLMQARAWKSRDRRIMEWLYKRYKAREDPVAALLEAEVHFRSQRPTLESYQQVRQLAIQFGQWEKIRPELLASLDRFYSDLLIQIALDEGDFAPVLVVVKYDRISAHYYSQTIKRVFDAVKALEATQADKVLVFYRQFAEYLIEQRNRQCYEEASRCLIKMRDLYQKLGQQEAWTSYITELREKNRNLRALKDVLTTAKL